MIRPHSGNMPVRQRDCTCQPTVVGTGGPGTCARARHGCRGAKAKLDWAVSTAYATPLVARQVCRLMLRVARKLIVSAYISTEVPLPVFAGAFASLKDAVVAHNRACDEAHLLYRRLAKRGADDVVKESYRSWFSYQDMPISLRCASPWRGQQDGRSCVLRFARGAFIGRTTRVPD